MTVQLVVSASPGERRYARIEDGRTVAVRARRDGGPPYVGAVYLGRVVRVDPGIKAAFVEIGLAKPAFLNLGKRQISEGAALAVRVKADPFAEKGARLSLDLPKDLAVPEGAKPPLLLLPPADPLDEIKRPDEAAETIENRPGQADPFDALGVSEALEEALSPLVRLPSGGRLMIERTAALWAVDVDTGGQKGADSAFRANQEAAVELARQIRLRNMGGRILADFAGLPRHRLGRIASLLKDELGKDEVPVHLGGITPLGLVEMVRERRSAALDELFSGPRARALTGLRQALALVRSQPAARPRLILDKAAVGLLTGELAVAREEAEKRLGHAIALEIGDKLEVLGS